MNQSTSFDGLLALMKRLRAPDGCPWDREQTHASLLPYLIEESAEVIEAAGENNPDHLCEELGDVLLQVVFHAQIAEEAGHFSIHDVIRVLSEKLIRRHPHVFGDAQADTAQAVSQQWDQIKITEGLNAKGKPSPSVLDKVPRSLPSLARAEKLASKAGKSGFRWATPADALAKVKEEWAELQAELTGSTERRQEELGDLLQALAVWASTMGMSAESALIQGNAKFERRFRALEAQSGGSEQMRFLSPHDLQERWKAIKLTQETLT
ncbi:MAG: nucleoside triphosphate pyrophosphohydrolase [Spirochaetales bacterium]|nr:nucleoside triphosphate pyrophosphohydrolase [Spirochaetales bacterium]